MLDLNIRKDFPLLLNNPNLIYFDNACTSLKPLQVIEAEKSYYTDLGACGGRSSHSFGIKTSEKTEEAREAIASFINAGSDELVWTRNTTEGLNLIINGFDYSKKNKVVTSVLEHHSLLLPLMRLRDEGKIKLEIVPCDEYGDIPIESWSDAIDRQTALVITNNGNNTTGIRQDADKISGIAHENNALICIDGAQGVPHHKTDFKKFDFLCFSAHKMLGPTGIGVLVIRRDYLKIIKPLVFGGGTVKTVSLDKAIEMPDHTRFEAGVQHYSGMLGFAAACNYLKKAGMGNIEAHEKILAKEMQKIIKDAGAEILGPDKPEKHSPLFSFNFRNAKPHDVALLLDKSNIALRSGFFCAQPAMEAIGAKEGAVRASCYLYNTTEELKKFTEALQKIKILYG